MARRLTQKIASLSNCINLQITLATLDYYATLTFDLLTSGSMYAMHYMSTNFGVDSTSLCRQRHTQADT